VGGTQSSGRGGLNKSTLAAFLPGQYPQATWVAFILATCNSSSPTRSIDAIRPLAVGPAACLRANQSSTPHTDLLGGPPLDPSPPGQPHLHPVAAPHVEIDRAAVAPDRSEERRVGKSVDLGGGRIKKKKKQYLADKILVGDENAEVVVVVNEC